MRGHILRRGDRRVRRVGGQCAAEIFSVGRGIAKQGAVGMVDDDFLSRMREGSLLVNMARGPVVDTDALVRHVSSGRIRAALDVVDPEPLPAGHPLYGLPGVLLTPHVGGRTNAMQPRMGKLLRHQIECLRTGKEPINLVLAGEA